MSRPHGASADPVRTGSSRGAATRNARARRVRVALSPPILLAVLVTSCTAAPAADSVSAAASAEDVCLELVDVGTLVFNMKSGYDAGRIPGQEYQGAMYLAASMLSRVGSSDDADVDSAVEGLKSAAGADAVDPGSEAWVTAFADVSDSCGAVLGEFGVRGWVGG